MNARARLLRRPQLHPFFHQQRSPASMAASPSSSSFSTHQHPQHPQHHPPWLQSLLKNKSPPSKIFAWTPENLAPQSPQPPQPPHTAPRRKDDLDRRIYILGVGNLGRLYASYISKGPDHPPITLVVHRKELLSQWVQSNGIEITRLGVLSQNKNLDIEWWTEEPPEHGQAREVAHGNKLRNLLISTKASAAMPEVDRLRGYLDSGSTVAFVQNGMSKLWPPHGAEYVSQRYPDGTAPNFLACITTHGVVSEGPFKSLHASPADACIGPVFLANSSAPSITYLTQQVAHAPQLDSKSVSPSDLWILQLEKLIVNATINPLTALMRCKNGILFVDPEGVPLRVMDRLVEEASNVFQALVLHESSADILVPQPRHNTSEDLRRIRESLKERFSQARLGKMLRGVGAKVGENTSSMLQDVRAGKKTEIRDFNGWIVDMADFLDQNLDVSCHRAVIDLVENGTVVLDNEDLASKLL